MPWVKIDDQFYNHPKLATLGVNLLPCVGLHTLALCWCNAYLTDGRIPIHQIGRLAGDLTDLLGRSDADMLIERLLAAGLWEVGPEKSEDFIIHDFLDYNPSRKEVLKTRKEREKSGRSGGLAKAKQTPSKILAKEKQKSTPSPYPSLDLKDLKKDQNIRPNGSAPTVDSEWWKSLKTNPAYAEINLEIQYAKMAAWCEVNRKIPSRRRFINWLNHAERPLTNDPATLDPNRPGYCRGRKIIV